jgi:hypothetical protein
LATIDHPQLIRLLQRAYSAEKAAAFAYVGHANSLTSISEREAVRRIEEDEWNHRRNVLHLLLRYEIPVSRFYEVKFHILGKIIGATCHVIGWFMPYFFAGKLESGNVCEYFVMMQYFHSLGIHEHDAVLYEMGIKEKEHEVYFLNQIKETRILRLFENFFGWGKSRSHNDVNLAEKYTIENSHHYCRKASGSLESIGSIKIVSEIPPKETEQ